MVVLAFLMPIVASMGGNAGMQTLAVTVRTLATNDLTKNNFNQNIFKEFNIGILNGIIFAIISSFIVQLWFQDIILSLIISISMILTMIVAGLFGILVPVTLKKMNIDPAIAGSIFIFFNVTGTNIPNNPATIIVKIIEIEIIKESIMS